MSLSSRKLVRTFHESDLIHNDDIINNYLHPDVYLHWNGSSGLIVMNYNDITSFLKGMRDSFEFSRCKIFNILADKEKVSICFDFMVKPIESSSEEVIGHFMSIWELKDNKLYKGRMISQSADTSSKT